MQLLLNNVVFHLDFSANLQSTTMKSYLLFSILFFSIIPSQEIPKSVLEAAEKEVFAYAKDYPGVSVSVSVNGEIAWNQVNGFSDIGAKTPVNQDTKFNIYSTSKLITGLAFLKLIHTQQLKSLDTKIREIDSSLPKSYDQITIRHLLTHSSGIRHYTGKKDWKAFNELRCSNPQEALKHFINDPLVAEPGEKKVYTTYGMALASHLLEKITGHNYQESLNQLLPFSSTILLDQENRSKATPYIRKGSNFKEIGELSAECKYGGGGLIASSKQLVEAGQMLYDGSLMPLNELKNLMKAEWKTGDNKGTSFAMGCGETDLDGQMVFYANMGGASPGGRSYLLVLADLKVAVAITTNCEGEGIDAYNLSMSLAKKFAGIE